MTYHLSKGCRRLCSGRLGRAGSTATLVAALTLGACPATASAAHLPDGSGVAARPGCADAASSGGKPGDAKPGDGKPKANKPTGSKPTDSKPDAGRPEAGEPATAQSAGSKPADATPPGDAKPAAGTPAEAKPEAGKPGDACAADHGAGDVGAKALDFARAQVGKGYSFGGVGPQAYDCSGLVWRSFYQAGLRWRRGSAAALFQAGGERVSRSQTRPGDLLFWSGNGRRSGIYHVAMYLGADRVIEAANRRSGVRISRIWRPRQVLPVALRLTD